jgi:hypothetical protein
MPNLIERPFDYIQSTGTLAANALSGNRQIRINSDAPFVCRARGAMVDELNSSFNLFSTKYTDADGRYRSNTFLNLEADLPASFGNLLTPVWPQIVYPPNSNIEYQVRNDEPAISNALSVLFRGITLHAEGTVYAPKLPAKFDVERYAYTMNVQIQETLANPTLLRDVFLFIQSDADFLITDTMLRSDISQGVGGFTDLRVRFKDRLGKYYSNVLDTSTGVAFVTGGFVPVNMILGTDAAFFGAGTGTDPTVAYPGIYLKANDYLAFDFLLNDTGFAQTLFFQVVFNGYKVFPR